MLRALRFYRVVDPTPPWLTALAFALGAYAVAIAWLDRRAVDEALAIALLWQMLGASTGFFRPAASGHFDPLLVSVPRGLLAISHFLYAAFPGLVLWAAVAVVDILRHQPPHHSLEMARLSALVFVTAACWSLSLSMPRMVVGAFWLLGIVAGATTRVGIEQYATLLTRETGSFAQAAHAAALALLCPFIVIGDAIPVREPAAAAMSILSALMLTAAVVRVSRRDYPLEAS